MFAAPSGPLSHCCITVWKPQHLLYCTVKALVFKHSSFYVPTVWGGADRAGQRNKLSWPLWLCRPHCRRHLILLSWIIGQSQNKASQCDWHRPLSLGRPVPGGQVVVYWSDVLLLILSVSKYPWAIYWAPNCYGRHSCVCTLYWQKNSFIHTNNGNQIFHGYRCIKSSTYTCRPFLKHLWKNG